MVRKRASEISEGLLMAVKVTSFVPQAINGNQKGTLKGMLETAIRVTSQAKALSPVAEKNGGQLRNSIMWKSYTAKGGITGGDPLTSRPKKNQIIVGSNTEYAVYQEFGTRKMAAQPYLRPAIDIVTNGTNGAKAMSKAMYNSVREYLKRTGQL
jgi:HK97 gp10 family phage protein